MKTWHWRGARGKSEEFRQIVRQNVAANAWANFIDSDALKIVLGGAISKICTTNFFSTLLDSSTPHFGVLFYIFAEMAENF